MAETSKDAAAEHEAWLAQRTEDVLEPELPIVDPHHHLWVRDGVPYLLRELLADLYCGHHVVATVFAECHAMYRPHGEEARRSLGETGFVTGVAAMSESGVRAGARLCGDVRQRGPRARGHGGGCARGAPAGRRRALGTAKASRAARGTRGRAERRRRLTRVRSVA